MKQDNIFDKFLPSSSLEISEEHLIEFFETMYQRQQIWYNRFMQSSKKPWSENAILNNHKFCNVYRELDKTSQWIIKNIIRNDNYDMKNKVWKACIARLFNLIEFLEVVDIPNYDDYDAEQFVEMVEIFEDGVMPSTNKKAYAINSWLAAGTTQGLGCARHIIPSLHKQLGNILFHGFLGGKSTVKDLIMTMRSVEGIGKFVAHEWYIDMCYFSKYTNESSNFTEMDWSNIGPGAEFGLRLVFPAMKKNIDTLRKLVDMSKLLLPDDFKYVQWNKDTEQYELCEHNLSLHQQEFHLCEYAKYFKIKHQVGRQRDKYVKSR